MLNRTGLLKLKKMAAYSTADMLGGGVAQIISSYFLAYLTFVEGMNPALAGICIMIGKIWDGISDPIMGVIVEKTHTKYGSIRPYFLIGVIPVFLSFFMLWYSFGINTEIGKTLYYSIAYIFFSTAYTIVIIPYDSLLPRMIDSYKDRTNYTSMRMIFSGIACVLSTFIYEYIINKGSNGLDPSMKGKFAVMGIVLGLFFALPLIITFFGTKENPRENSTESITIKSIIKNYGEILHSSSYKKYYLLQIFSAFLSSMVITGMSFFAYIILSQDKILGFTVITIVLTIKGAAEIGFFPVNVVLMKKYNKHMPYIIDVPLIILACLIGALIPANSSAVPFIISICFLGMGVSCLSFVPMTLLPDLADVDELIYGKRREGLSAGLATLGKKISNGLSFFVSGVILTAFGLQSDNPENAIQTAATIWGVKVVYAVLPIVCAVLILLVAIRYKINQSNHDMIKAKIALKHQNGSVILTEEEKKECEAISGMPYDKLWLSKPADQS